MRHEHGHQRCRRAGKRRRRRPPPPDRRPIAAWRRAPVLCLNASQDESTRDATTGRFPSANRTRRCQFRFRSVSRTSSDSSPSPSACNQYQDPRSGSHRPRRSRRTPPPRLTSERPEDQSLRAAASTPTDLRRWSVEESRAEPSLQRISRLIGVASAVEQVSVDGQRDGGVGMAHLPGHEDDVRSLGDQEGGIRVSQVVEANPVLCPLHECPLSRAPRQGHGPRTCLSAAIRRGCASKPDCSASAAAKRPEDGVALARLRVAPADDLAAVVERDRCTLTAAGQGAEVGD
jgi:hypothetical protein